jgi:alpha-beta hydrolase superfamily lysophospholipase
MMASIALPSRLRLSRLSARTLLLLAMVLGVGACAADYAPEGVAVTQAAQTSDGFVMPDGAVLPYRNWMPPPGVKLAAVVLALHGMNDSRDAWEYPAPALAAAGIAVFAPDQRGFGATAARGYWPGAAALQDDARTMARLLRARYPAQPLYLMGESMGAAVLLALAASPDPPAADGWIFSAPAVWGRAEQTLVERAGLWLAFRFAPGMRVSGLPGVRITASDNHAALVRLSRDPLTLHETRVDAVKGLVDLMDLALAATAHLQAPSLFLYGGKDELVPPRATLAAWSALPRDRLSVLRLAYYPPGYHLLLRDQARDRRLADVIAWMRHPAAPLPSGADQAAVAWLARQGAGPALPSAPVSGYALR